MSDKPTYADLELQVKKLLGEAAAHRVTALQDITIRRRAEEELRKSEERLNAAQRVAKIGNWEIDLSTRKRFWSDEVFRIFGHKPGEIEPDGDLVKSHVHPDDLDLYFKMRIKRFEEKKDVDYEYRIINKMGEERVVHLIAKAIFDEAGLPIRFFGTLQDITDRKRGEEEKLKLESQLRQVRKMEAIGTLIGGIAHEFNNILGIIIGNTELALDDIPDWNPVHVNLEQIKAAGLRAKDVVVQLLSFSQKTEQKKKPITIVPIVRESMKLMRASIPPTISIRSDIPQNIGTIEADPIQIHQVLVNLCANAWHAMEESGGILEVCLSDVERNSERDDSFAGLPAGRYVQLSVKDSGHGIDPQIHERIFDPYFTTKEIGKGTGMGLSLTHGIVKNHDGEVFIDSEPDKGTTVRVLFPSVEREPEAEDEISEELPGGNESILLIDDEEAFAGMGRQVLERLGYRVEAVTDPENALIRFRSNPDHYDLIFTDMTMPKMTGIVLIKAIAGIRPDIPVILCTGFCEKIDEENAEELGIAAYVMKPFNIRDIANIIRQVLDGR